MAQFGVELPLKGSAGKKGPVAVSDSASLCTRIVAKAGSEQLRLENLKGWKPLHSGSMSQGCTTLLGKELFLNQPGSLTSWKDFSSILPSSCQVTVDLC